MNYYNKKYIQFLIIENTKDREMAMIPHIRSLKVNSINSLLQVLNLIHWDSRKCKLYRSVARVKNIPFFTFNMNKRSSETSIWFQDQFCKDIESYDLFLDFDKEEESSFQEVLNEVKQITDVMDDYEVPYYVIFSGNKGFQVVIDGKYIKYFNVENGTIQPHKQIAEKIKKNFKFKFLDLSNNGVYNRLCKVPYSLCLPKNVEDKLKFEEGNMNVVLPLDKEQIENFDVEDMKLKNVMVNPNVRLNKRGNIERFSLNKMEDKMLSVENFIKAVNI